MQEVRRTEGENRLLDEQVHRLEESSRDLDTGTCEARRFVEQMALAWQASLLIRSGNNLVSDAFCSARLSSAGGKLYGTLSAGIDCRAIMERARPRLDGQGSV